MATISPEATSAAIKSATRPAISAVLPLPAPAPHDYFRFAGAFLRTFFSGAFFAATFFTTGFLGAVFLETLLAADFLGAAFFFMGVVFGGGFTFPSDRPEADFLTLNAVPGLNPTSAY
jgi:hypothetical protein